MSQGSNYNLIAPGLTGGTFTGPSTFPAGTAGAPGIGVGETTTGLYLGATKVLGLAAGGVAFATLDASAATHRMYFPDVTTWLGWNNGTNGVILIPGGAGSANDGVLEISGFGTSKAGLDLGGRVRIKNDSSTLISMFNAAETQSVPVSFAVNVSNGSSNVTPAATQSGLTVSGLTAARATTLPTAATAYVGQAVNLTSEGGFTATLTIPASTTVQVGATSWAASSSHACAAGGALMLVCTSSGATATWAALSMLGTWT